MSEEAKIRVRLDTTGAKGDLADLYRQMANAPSVRTAGALSGGGGGGAGGGGGGGGFSIGGMAIGWGTALAGIGVGLFGRDTVRDAGSMLGALTHGPSRAIADFLFGTAPSAVQASDSAIEQVKKTMGFAVGMGAPMGAAKSLYDSLMTYEEPKARGERMIEDALGGKSAAALADAMKRGEGGLVGEGLQLMKEFFEFVKNNWPF